MPRKKNTIVSTQPSTKKVDLSAHLSSILEVLHTAPLGLAVDTVDAEVYVGESKTEAKFTIKARGSYYDGVAKAYVPDGIADSYPDEEVEEPQEDPVEHPDV